MQSWVYFTLKTKCEVLIFTSHVYHEFKSLCGVFRSKIKCKSDSDYDNRPLQNVMNKSM